jgi:RimJ/RimL family protein N-acetyltransferase
VTRLRAVVEADLPLLERQRQGPEQAGEFSWYGYRPTGDLRRRVANGDVIHADGGTLAVVDDDDLLVGEVSWIRVFNGPPPHGWCWNIGIWMLPEQRRNGHGSAAQRQLAAYLFDNTYLERVEAGTETGNVAEQRALEKAGFTREGVLRHACFRAGAWRDMVVYSKLRGEP